MDIRGSDFLYRAYSTLRKGTEEERKETVETLLLYRLIYIVPDPLRDAICETIQSFLRSPDRALRYWSAAALGEFNAVVSLPALILAAQDEADPYIRMWMESAIAHLAGDPHVTALRLGSTDVQDRTLASAIMFFDEAVASRRLLASQLGDEEPDALAWKLLALPGPLQRVLRAPLTLGPTWRRIEHTVSSVHISVPSTALKSLLLSGHPRVSEFAIWNLALTRDRSALPLVQDIAKSPLVHGREVREWAYKYLGFVPHESSVPLLRQAMANEDDPGAREGIAFALGEIASPSSFETILELFSSDKEDGVRAWCVRALGNFDPIVTNPESELISVVEREGSDRVVREAYGALTALGGSKLLKKADLLTEHAANDAYQTEVVSLLLALAVKAGDYQARAALVQIMQSLPCSLSPILQQARALTETYGISRFQVSSGFAGSGIADYSIAFERLIDAALHQTQSVVQVSERLREACRLFGRAAEGETHLVRPMARAHRRLADSPTANAAKFYADLCATYLQIASAIGHRLSLRVNRARKDLETAATFFSVLSLDPALPFTESQLCSALSLLCRAQLTACTYLDAVGEADKLDASRDLSLILAAGKARAESALRPALARYLGSLSESVEGIVSEEFKHGLVDSACLWNRLGISIPVLTDAPTRMGEILNVRMIRNDSAADRIDVTLLLSVADDWADRGIPFSAQMSIAHQGRRLGEWSLMEFGPGSPGGSQRGRFVLKLDESHLPVDEVQGTIVVRFGDFDLRLSRGVNIRVKAAGRRPSSRSAAVVDMGIVTALEVELLALLRQLEDVRLEQDESVPLSYYRGRIGGSKHHQPYEVAAVWLLGKGNTHAAAGSARLLARWHPAYVIMLGLAGGIPRQVLFGDVIVGTMSYYYELAKAYKSGIEVQPDPLPADALLLERARAYRLESIRQGVDWATAIATPRPKPGRQAEAKGKVEVHFAPIASGEKVIRDPALRDRLATACPGLAGVAMEGAGVARAALLESNRPRFLEIRAVSDFADGRKNDVWHSYSADAAATFFAEFMKSHPVPNA